MCDYLIKSGKQSFFEISVNELAEIYYLFILEKVKDAMKNLRNEINIQWSDIFAIFTTNVEKVKKILIEKLKKDDFTVICLKTGITVTWLIIIREVCSQIVMQKTDIDFEQYFELPKERHTGSLDIQKFIAKQLTKNLDDINLNEKKKIEEWRKKIWLEIDKKYIDPYLNYH